MHPSDEGEGKGGGVVGEWSENGIPRLGQLLPVAAALVCKNQNVDKDQCRDSTQG